MSMPLQPTAALDGLLYTSSRLLAGSGTPLAVCDPHGVATNASATGSSGLLMSKTCTPSCPAGVKTSPHMRPPAGVGEFQDRTRMLPQTITSPWLPVVVPPTHSV